MSSHGNHGWKALLLAVLVTAGCGSGSGMVSAGGTVTLDGEPLAGVVVEFRPVDPGGTPSFGLTDASGRYRLMRTAFESGVVPGNYAIRIYADSPDNAAIHCGCELPAVPARYRARSELRATVEDRRRQRFDFDLASP